jgi:hypothetical protein
MNMEEVLLATLEVSRDRLITDLIRLNELCKTARERVVHLGYIPDSVINDMIDQMQKINHNNGCIDALTQVERKIPEKAQ